MKLKTTLTALALGLAALQTGKVVAAKVVIIRCWPKAVNPQRCGCWLFRRLKAIQLRHAISGHYQSGWWRPKKAQLVPTHWRAAALLFV